MNHTINIENQGSPVQRDTARVFAMLPVSRSKDKVIATDADGFNHVPPLRRTWSKPPFEAQPEPS